MPTPQRSRLLFGLALVVLLARPAPGQQDPGALVDRVLEAYDGWTALSTVSSYRM